MSIIDPKETAEDEAMTAISMTSRAIVHRILATQARLLKLPNLRPSEEINGLLGVLVPLCCEIHDDRVVSQV